ncbi:MAG: EAL domain-containing protein, partial [Ferrimonas sp.]
MIQQHPIFDTPLAEQFSLAYQPKVQNHQIVALEALLRPKLVPPEEFFSAIEDTIALDLAVIGNCMADVQQHQLKIAVSINIHPSSVANHAFVQQAIAAVRGYNIVFELVEYDEVDMCDVFLSHIQQLKAAGIRISVDDFGKDFATTELALSINADEVKFDMSWLEGIDTNFIQFKHISYLYCTIRSYCTDRIIFEGVETQRQKDLIDVFAENPIYQGYYFYKPMTMNELFSLTEFVNENRLLHAEGHNNLDLSMDYGLYNFIRENDVEDLYSEEVNGYLKKHDELGLIYNPDVQVSIQNLKNVYFSRSSAVHNGVISLFDSTSKVIVFRNEEGIVTYDNQAHQDARGYSTLGLNPKRMVAKDPAYELFLKLDKKLLDDTSKLYMKNVEFYEGQKYDVLREKLSYNNRQFIAVTTSSVADGLAYGKEKDDLTKCYTRSFIKTHVNSYDGRLVAFLDMNGFKKINDTFGHTTGDKCLVDFVCLTRSFLRRKDIL